MFPAQDIFQTITDLMGQYAGDSDGFVTTLRSERIPHLSYSRLSSVEFCPQRYYIEYILMADEGANPEYFNKGKAFHRLAAEVYTGMAHHESPEPTSLANQIGDEFEGENRDHLLNAAQLLLENLWQDYEVVGVEQPFVMLLEPDLPPCVGVIDLILRRGDQFVVIDHKTGRAFPKLDGFQLAVYQEYIRQTYGVETCQSFFDCYRWVNHLGRIRKPAFQRSEVISGQSLDGIRRRFSDGYEIIRNLDHKKSIPRTGECYLCSHRKFCWER
jgi:CRISPR/Cas system-associated exonuclease Cas4 (RecB family)